MQAEPYHVRLEHLAAPIANKAAGHNLVVHEVAREVPVVALQVLLPYQQPQAVCPAVRDQVRDAIDHQDLPGAQLVDHICVLAPEHATPLSVAQGAHVALVQVGLLAHHHDVVGDGVLFTRVAPAALFVRVHHSFADRELLLGEKPCHAVPHFDQKLSVDVAIVREEEHRDLAVLFRERVDRDVVLQCLPLLRHAVERQGRVEQAVASHPFALKIDPEIADQHEVALSRLDKDCPRDVSAL